VEQDGMGKSFIVQAILDNRLDFILAVDLGNSARPISLMKISLSSLYK
jgi:hypothetical protein